MEHDQLHKMYGDELAIQGQAEGVITDEDNNNDGREEFKRFATFEKHCLFNKRRTEILPRTEDDELEKGQISEKLAEEKDEDLIDLINECWHISEKTPEPKTSESKKKSAKSKIIIIIILMDTFCN